MWPPLFSIKTSVVMRHPARRLRALPSAPADSSCSASRTQRPQRLPPEGCSVPEKVLRAVISTDHSMDDCSLSLRITRVTLNIWWLLCVPPPLSPLLSLEEGSLKLRLCQLKICLLITLLKLDFLVSGRPVSGRRALASQWPVDRRQNVNSAETPPFCIVLIPKTPFVRERRRQFLLFDLEKKKWLFVIETEEWKCQHI